MSNARLRALAEQDLIDIWRYTAEKWGYEQADTYLDSINRGIQLLTDHPEVGADRGDIRPGYRVYFVNRHGIYYLATPTAIEIVRVLHFRMDTYGRF